MGQQAADISSTSPSAKSRRDTQIFNPLPKPPVQQQENEETQLSFSEPTLLFPRPQGNQNLAHWISSSNPDIMRLTSTPTEEAGLSDSTYELIGATDTESQDGNYTDNISESVGSLDFHRPDDVVSLAGTEHTCDEESVLDATEDHPIFATPQFAHLETNANEDNESDDDDNSSRASLEYADNSLRTPSILTPDASRYLDTEDDVHRGNTLYSWFSSRVDWSLESLPNVTSQAMGLALPALLMFICIVVPAFYPAAQQDAQLHLSSIVSTASQTSFLTQAAHNQRPDALTPTSGVALIPLQESPDEGLFRLRKPTISFMPHGKHDVLIHVGQDIRDTWLSKKCLDVAVLRSNQPLEFTLSPVNDGILVKFPRREAYGVVNLAMRSTCRPKTRKAIKVYFGKGIIVDAFERTKSLAQDLSELVPVAAQEAERCYAGAKRVLESAAETFAYARLVGTERVQDLLLNANIGAIDSVVSEAFRFWKEAAGAIDEAVANSGVYMKTLKSVRGAQSQLRLSLLDAQVSARMWWLKIQGKDDEYIQYAIKAQAYLQQKKAAAKKFVQGVRLGAKTRA